MKLLIKEHNLMNNILEVDDKFKPRSKVNVKKKRPTLFLDAFNNGLFPIKPLQSK